MRAGGKAWCEAWGQLLEKGGGDARQTVACCKKCLV